jgi:hypothetical protein
MKKQTTTKRDEHPFFCEKKKCRKTAWATPEYLIPQDWENLSEMIQIISSGDLAAFCRFVSNKKGSSDFFYRVIGWPEGFRYCQSYNYCEKTGFQSVARDLELMRGAIFAKESSK